MANKKQFKLRVKVFCTSFIVLIAFLYIPTAHAALQTIETPTPPIDINEAPVINLQSGTAVYSYPIRVPPGTNDLAPTISLNYSSTATSNPITEVAAGWQLSRDYIQRDILYTPLNTSDDTFTLHFQGSSHNLVYIPSENVYKSKIDAFFQLKRFTSGGSGASAVYWILKTKDGTSFRFGFHPDSQTTCASRSYEDKWHLDQVTDTNGNNIFYTYIYDSGLSYLSNIKYNTDQKRDVSFSYDTSLYTRKLYIQGCNVSQTKRLTNIQVKYENSLVRQYDLQYTPAANGMSLLSSILEKGSDGSALPVTTFIYNPEIHTWNTQFKKWIDNAPTEASVTMNNVELIDVTGDGRPDIVQTRGYGGPDFEWIVFRNTGSSWNTTYEVWIPRTAHIEVNLEQLDQKLADVDGDGLVDIVRSNNMGGPSNWWRVYKNTGSGWNTNPETWIQASPAVDLNLIHADLRVADVTGDGRPDIVRVRNYGGPDNEWEVYRNTGSSWNATPEVWISRTAHIEISLLQQDVTMADVNGDGLTDIIRSANYGGPDNEWTVYKNNGNQWSTTPEVWIPRTAHIEINLNQINVTFADANGDGLLDIVRPVNLGGPNNEWRVYLNTGNAWATQWEAWVSGIPFEVNLEFNDVRVADFNGDGMVDILRVYSDGGPNYSWHVWLNDGYAPNLLQEVKTPQGGLVDYEYKSALTFDNTALSFPIYVVTKSTRSNGMTNSQATSEVSNYTYAQGIYNYTFGQREFRGFGQVHETQPNQSKITYLFHQDDDTKGKPDEVLVSDSQGNPYSAEEFTWGSSEANGVFTTLLSSKIEKTFDGTATNPKVRQTDFLYDSFGNTTKVSKLGDIAITGDERYEHIDYTYNTTDWIVVTPKHVSKKDSDDNTIVAESWFYYDNNLSIEDTPINGNLTKEEKWNNQGNNPVTTYAYDDYGNQISITDPNQHTTQYIFGITDSTFTYPEKIINAKQQETNFAYDLATGNLLSEKDANNFETKYTYDSFGRKLKEIKPYDSETFPTVEYAYLVDGNAPEGVKVAQRLTSGQAATYDVYSFTDGLGRIIQTRKPAESEIQQIVMDTYYHQNGEVLKKSNPYYIPLVNTYTDPQTVPMTSHVFDPIKRVINTTNPDSTTRIVEYDHWMQKYHDENGNITTRLLNAYDQIIKVEEYNDSEIYTTSYDYDPSGNLLRITDAELNVIGFEHDSLGRKTKLIDPDIGTWNYVYDVVGNVVSTTDNRNVVVSTQYDELNRMTLKDFPIDTDIVYTYDQPTIGALASVQDETGTSSYLYDSRLRLTKETKSMDTIEWDTQFTYDAADRVVTRSNPDGEVLTYLYNNQGEVSSVSDILAEVHYNEANKIVNKQYANGLTTSFSYDQSAFRLTNITTSSFQDLDYEYDNVGNISNISDNLNVSQSIFGYDELNRLTNAINNGPMPYNHIYNYDPIGNLLEIVTDEGTYSYEYGNSLPHAISAYTTPETDDPENIALSGTANRWWKNSSSASNANKIAEPLLNDDSIDVDVKLSTNAMDNANAWEAAGVIWDSEQAITSVEFVNGNFDTTNNSGVFSGNFKMQFSSDGNSWVDSGWACSPAYEYNSAAAANVTYVCSGAEQLTAKGVRVTGQVKLGRNGSGYANAKEVRAFSDEVSVGFTDLTAQFIETEAQFSFDYNGTATNFTIDMSTTPDFSANVYPDFVQGSTSPVIESNPQKWNEYQCDSTLYWQITSDLDEKSLIESASVVCDQGGNIALLGVGYRWWNNQNTASNANKVAEPLLNDDLVEIDVKLSTTESDTKNAWEAAGVTWDATQIVSSVDFVNGSFNTLTNSGVFSNNFKLQYSIDGTSWADSSWSCSPSYQYNSPNAADVTYSCTGTEPLLVKGVRVTGQVSTGRNTSLYANVIEVRAF